MTTVLRGARAAALLAATGSAAAAGEGLWTDDGFGQGFLESSVSAGEGNRMVWGCSLGAAFGSTLFVELAGAPPNAAGPVIFAFNDAQPVAVPLDLGGFLGSDTAVEAGYLIEIAQRLRDGDAVTVTVTFDDGRTATFSLDGADEAVADECGVGATQQTLGEILP
ncbi:hypothetical protein [Wenxinia marina]|nr:hypothetical protein [Wenxinia marina]